MPESNKSESWMKIPISQAVRDLPCTCIDGRTTGARYSIAGGSFGLVLEVLAVMESQGRLITDELVEQVMSVFTSKVGVLYLHSDQHSMERLFCKLGLPENAQLQSLSESQVRVFIEFASRSDFIGCGHIKQIALDPIAYGIPQCVTEKALKVFYQQVFSGSKFYLFDVLQGEHQEQAVIIVESNDSSVETRLLNSDRQQQNFFWHRPLQRELIKQLLTALQHAGITEISEPELVARHNRNAEQTLKLLAPELPVQRIDF